MDNTVIQAGIWIAAGGLMFLFLKRRRSRKPTR
jgi:LPXTG-motif cell wall-anchored protein